MQTSAASTVRSRLWEANLRSRRPAIRPVLSVVNRNRRLAWVRSHVNWTRQQWSTVFRWIQVNPVLYWRLSSCVSTPGLAVYGCHHSRTQSIWWQFCDDVGWLDTQNPPHLVDGILNGVRYWDEVLQPIAPPAYVPRIGQIHPISAFVLWGFPSRMLGICV